MRGVWPVVGAEEFDLPRTRAGKTRGRFAPGPFGPARLGQSLPVQPPVGPSCATARPTRRPTVSLLATTALSSGLRGLPFALLVGCLIAGGPVLAGPQGGNVVAGAADIVQSTPQRLDINQSSDKAVIDWRSFSIGIDEHTNFNQPSAGSIILNRVTGDARSDILGRLTANGQVMLINPHGILFGKTARVDVAGLVATTIDIANDDFMAGRFNFDRASDPGAVVINRGQITVAEGGLAAFVAPGVENSGVIRARLGRVALASGNSFTLDLYGDSLVHLAVGDEVATQLLDPEGEKLTALVGNSGTIRADGGTVLLAAAAARQVVDHVINMDGIVEARSVHAENGEIVLLGGDEGIVRVAGRLDASGRGAGESGGTVKVLGEKVGLYDGAKIGVSGDAGGGTALIGGNFQGRGPERSAARTFVAEGATIAADALSRGDGGRVIVWAEEFTNYRGSIMVRGGAAGGDGGFVEVSGKQSLAFEGRVDALAPAGQAGTLLLDPKNITIDNAGAAALTDVDAFADTAAADVAINASTINAAGANVTLQASNDITVDATGTINMANFGVGLTMQAGRSILINADITTDLGAVTLIANETAANGVVDANRDAGAAAITMADGTTINTNNGAIAITLGTGAGLTNATSGDITLENLDGNSININNDGTTAGSDIVRASADGLLDALDIALDVSDSTTNTTGAIGSSGAPIRVDTIELEARSQGGGLFLANTSGTVRLGGADVGGLTGLSTASGNGAISVTNNGAIRVEEAIAANGSGNITLDAGTSNYTQSADVASTSGDITITADTVGLNSGTIGSSGSLVLQPSTVSRTIGIGGGSGVFNLTDAEIGRLTDGFGSITIGASGGTGAVDIDAVTLNDPVTVRGGAVTVTGLAAGANAITLTSSSTIDEDANDTTADITTSGTLTLTAGGAIGASGGNGALDLTVGTLQATTSAGGIFLRESDTLSIGSSGVETTGGNAAIELTLAAGNLTLDGVITANGSGDVTLTSAGTIVDDTADTTTDITTAGTLMLSAGGAIGASGGNGALDLTVGTLQATTSSGGIFLSESDTLIIGGTGVQTTASNAAIEIALAAGDLTLNEDITANGSGNVTLTLSGSGAAVITDNADDDIASTSGDITITADTLTLASGNITSSGALVLQPNSTSRSVGVSGGNGDFNLSTTELDLLSDGFSSITIGRSDSDALMSISADTYRDPMVFRAGGSAGRIGVGGAITSAAANASLTFTAGNILSSIGQISSGAGDITITADSVGISAEITGTGALVIQPVTATRTVGIGGGTGDFNLTDTEIGRLSDGFSSITIGASGGTGAVDVDAVTFNDNVTIRGGAMAVTGLNAGSNAVTLTSSGAITDGGAGTDVTGSTLTLTADNGIGTSGDSLGLSGTTLNLTNTTSVGIFINNNLSDAAVTAQAQTVGDIRIDGSGAVLTLVDLDTADGAITVSSGSGIVASDVTAGGSHDITLTTTGSANVTLGAVSAAGDQVTITSAGAISEAGTADADVDITADTLNLTAAGAIGASGGNNALDLSVGTLQATTSAGGIFLNESDTLVIGGTGVQTTAGNADIEIALAAGDLTLNEDITAHGSGNVTLALSGAGAALATSGAADDIASTSGAITITADTLTLANGTISSSGALVLQPNDAARGVGLNHSTGDFNLTSTELGLLSDGFSSITIGRSDATGQLFTNGFTFRDPLVLRMGGTGGRISVNNSLTRAAADISLTLTAGGLVSLTSLSETGGGSGDVTVSGSNINLNDPFSISSGNITLTATSGNVTVADTLSTGSGNISVTASSSALLDEAVSSGGGNITVTADFFQLLGAVSAGAGDISVTTDSIRLISAGALTGTGSLPLQPTTTTTTIGLGAGATGDFSLDADELARLSDGFSAITIGRDGGTGAVDINAHSFNDPVTIRGGAMTVTGLAAGANDITLTSSSTIDEDADDTTADITTSGTLSLTAGGAIGASGGNGALDLSIGTLQATTSAGGIFLRESDTLIVGGTGVQTTGGNAAIEIALAAGDLTLNEDITANGSGDVTLTLSGTGAAVTTDNAADDIASTSGDITVTADTLTLAAGNISSSGALVLQPATTNRTIGLGNAATGDFELDATELGLLSDGFSSITIGRSNGQHAIAVNAVTFNDPVTIRTPSGGSIAVDGQITGAGNASVTLDGSGATTTLAANIVTNGTTVEISDSLQVSGARTIDTTNGDSVAGGAVTISGTIDGANQNGTDTLTIDAAFGAIGGGNDGTVTLSGAVSGADGANDLESLSISGGQIDVANITVDVGNLAVSGSNIDLNGSTYQADGNITFTGAVDLTTSGVSVDSDGAVDGNILFSSTIDGGQVLTLTAGTGDVTLSGAVGGATALSSLSASGASISAGSVTTSGTQGYTGALTTDGTYTTTNANVTVTGATTLGGATTVATGAGGGDISFSSTIDGGQVLTLTAGTGDVTLSGAVGGATALSSLSASGASISAGSVTTSGTQSYTGSVTFNSTYTTTGSDFTVTGASTLASDTTISTGTGGGDILFDGAVDGTTADSQSLTLTAGTGDITFAGNVGVTTRLGGVTINSAKDVTVQATMETTTFTQAAGSGTTDTGSSTLNTSGAITITAADITGAINGGDLTLTTENGIEVTVDVASLTIDGPRATIIGTVAGQGGAETATVITITTRGPGPYTANGFTILGLDQTGSGTASRQDVELAAMPTSVMLRPSAQPPTPGEVVYMQFVPVQRGANYGPIESPYATNVFQLPFSLVAPAEGTEAAYEGQPGIGDSLWQQLGVGAPAPAPAGSVSLDQPGLTTALAPSVPGLDEGVAVP